MTVTGEKKKEHRRRRTPKMEPSPDKKSAEYTLVYKNPRPDPVKPKRKPDKPSRPPKGDPVSFVMEYSHIYDCDDDTI